jgi:hypothetical protein
VKSYITGVETRVFPGTLKEKAKMKKNRGLRTEEYRSASI